MWLKKLVAVSMIITLVGMITIAAVGIFAPSASKLDFSLTQSAPITAPVIDLSAQPTEITAGVYSALKWSVTGTVDSCTATGDWQGSKTPFGTESTGRLKDAGQRTYTLTCKNSGGSATQTIKVTVKPADSTTASTPATSTPTTPTPQATVYCQGASPCYGPREIAAHGSAGNCWGWNGNRVINISGFDAAFHQAKSGIGSIELSSVCGKDLAPALGGKVSAGGQTRDHNNSSKSNADRNMIPYFIGYYDGSKP